VTDGVSGLLRPADAQALGAAVAGPAADPAARRRLAAGGLEAVAHRTWERSLARLAAGYRAALAPTRAGETRRAA
jgi:glycosyltransferase involved in cell wall biosynthesis